VTVELKWKGAWKEKCYWSEFDCSPSSVKESAEVDRIHVDRVGLNEFIDQYEKPYVPCVILGATDKWDAQVKWTPEVGYLTI